MAHLGFADNRVYCTPITDQASCGSCTAFGLVSAWEEKLKKEKGITVDLSERHLFFCAGGGCNTGNTVDKTLSRAMVGVALETCLPYGNSASGVDHKCAEGITCTDWWTHGKKIKSWVRTYDDDGIKQKLDAGKAFSCTMMIYQSFMNYVSGVYHKLANDPFMGGHMMAIVGYDDSKSAWLVRNSWGTGWGMLGYIWVGYKECGIENDIVDFELDDALPEPEPNPPDPPTPSPCPTGNGTAKVMNFLPWLLHRTGRFYYLNPPKKCKCGE